MRGKPMGREGKRERERKRDVCMRLSSGITIQRQCRPPDAEFDINKQMHYSGY